MSTAYVSNTGATSSRGTWYANAINYKYNYETFIPGEDVNLDKISLYVESYTVGGSTFTTPTNFTVSLFADAGSSTQPGPLISTLSGPGSPAGSSYNDYSPLSTTILNAGSKYWLGFSLSSATGSDLTRVRTGTNSGNFTLGSGWSVPDHITVEDRGFVGGATTTTGANPFVYSLYATSRAICFCKGTLIRRADGTESPIEQLVIGDLIATSSGPLPVKWIARQTIRKAECGPELFARELPVTISADSILPGIPKKDLKLSEGHGVYADGRIVNASCLINEISIVKDTVGNHPDLLEYYHLEFDDEVLVEANGLLACSYWNELNRRSFDNYSEYIRLYGDPDKQHGSQIKSETRNRVSLSGHIARVRRTWSASTEKV